MNQFGITHDWPGLCALCHVEIAEFDGSHQNGVPIIARFKPTKDEIIVALDDGSKMRVTVCTTCGATFRPEDCGKLLESVRGGWEKECEILVRDESKPDWDETRKIEYLAKYSKLEVVDRLDTIWSVEDKAKIKNDTKENKK